MNFRKITENDINLTNFWGSKNFDNTQCNKN